MSLSKKIISALGGLEILQNRIAMASAFIMLVCICSIIIVLFYWWDDKRKNEVIYHFNKEKKARTNLLTDVLFKKLSANIKRLEDDRGKKPGWSQNVTMLILAMLLAMGIFLLYYKQVFLGVAMPIILLIVITKVSELIVDSNDEKIQASLPMAIDSIIRAMSKHDDLPGILYDAASSGIEDPIKTMLQQMSIKMINSSIQGTLNEFMETNKNIWIYSLSFTLLNYTEDSSKEDTVVQLRKLKAIIDKENKDKNANKTEKKMTVAINYVLCVFAILGLLGNLAFNSGAKDFFFASIGGLACFVIGITLVIVSIFSNLLLGKGKI